ncbi:MAG TPA: SagB family peptide dehydrogenase [Vicinamibacterales bacterium]|nr:SagB family peptide dehydrogenase [Vicinamibacterales bacterium]
MPISNRDIDEAWRYHDATKHSYASVRSGPHTLDWPNQPRPFKLYRDLEPLPLPRELPRSGASAVEAVAALIPPASGETRPDLPHLAALLFLSAGITKRKRYPGGEIAFRAASCTGALYEIDLYIVCGDLDGLRAGVYHFDPAGFALRRLRDGDHRGALLAATAGEPAIARAPVTIVCTGTYWRNAWKYRARTYRHFGWDNGTILANLLAAASAFRLPARIVCGFVDDEVNRLLGLDTEREVAFSMVALGRTSAPPPPVPSIPPLAAETVPPSRSEIDYPIMRRMHAASSLESASEVAAWRDAANALRAELGALARPNAGAAPDDRVRLPVPAAALPRDPLEEVILRRGSTRQFDRNASWTLDQLALAMACATAPLPADFLGDETRDPSHEALGRGLRGLGTADPAERSGRAGGIEGRPAVRLNDLYLIVHAVDGLAPGAYVLSRDSLSLDRLRHGRFRAEAGYLGLEQELPADASVVVFFLADLHRVFARLGNRGYRAAQLEAGLLGGRLYLAAYAQRLGASGLTFYDDDVVEFFSPHAAGKSAMFCMTLGRSVRRR